MNYRLEGSLNQKDNIRLIKKTIRKIIDSQHKNIKVRYIKIGASKYQEVGLPDLQILIYNVTDKKHLKFWIEIKRNWNDKPSKLQIFNIIDLRCYGYRTGFIAGDEFKESILQNAEKIEDYFRYWIIDGF